MVDFGDLKIYKTTNNLGGAITATEFLSATPNNLFSNVPANELVAGEDYYACIYLKNVNTSEKMAAFKLWLSDKSFPRDTEIKWGFDTSTTDRITLPYLSFDGSNDYVDCTNDATLWSQSLTKFSFSFWIYPTAGWDGNDRFVLRHSTAVAQSFHCYIQSGVTGGIKFQIRNAANTSIEAQSSALTLNTWNFISCTYDNSLGSANIKIYVNATVGGTTANLTEAINKSATLQLSDSSTDFKGNMKDFRWWTTKALTQTEIDSLYNDGTGPAPDYWLMINEGTGNPVDTISGTKVGTLTNGTAWITGSGVAQTIAGKYTAPIGVTWHGIETLGTAPVFGDLQAGSYFPIWIWLHVAANSEIRENDNATFTTSLNIPQGGTGSGGGTGSATPGTYHYSPYKTFTSVSDVVTQNDSSTLDLNNFSICVWFRTSHDFTPGEGTFVRKGFGYYQTSADVKNYFLKINNEPYANELEAGFEELDGTLHPTFTDSLTWNDGQWHFASVTYDGLIVRLYVDGVERHTHGTSATPGTNARKLYVGADPDEPTSGSHRVYYGDMDEVRVWNTALTPTEITNLFQNGVVPQSGAIVYENLFGGSGTTTGTGGNPPPTNSDYKIAIAGDWGCEPETDDVISLIQGQDYDLLVGVGDNAYEAAGCWTTKFTPLKPIMKSGYGNHEDEETGGTAPYKTFFGNSQTYFSFQFQNVFFIIGDTNIDIDPGSNQHNFITSECARVLNDPTVTWRVFINHHPWFGSGSDHPANEFNQVEALHTLLANNKFNFVCCGHNHHWVRSHQVVYNSSSPTSPTIVDSSSPYSRTTTGIIHLVSGTGGHDTGGGLYSLPSSASWQAYANRTHNGVWEMVATNNGQTLTCSYVDIDGNKYDTFTIS
jgi:hypothetical protein